MLADSSHEPVEVSRAESRAMTKTKIAYSRIALPKITIDNHRPTETALLLTVRLRKINRKEETHAEAKRW